MNWCRVTKQCKLHLSISDNKSACGFDYLDMQYNEMPQKMFVIYLH